MFKKRKRQNKTSVKEYWNSIKLNKVKLINSNNSGQAQMAQSFMMKTVRFQIKKFQILTKQK